MTTRLGVKYQPEPIESNSKMDSNQLAAAIQIFSDKIDNLTGIYKEHVVRLANLEENRINNDQIRNTPPRSIA